MNETKRPIGLAILAVLQFIGGLILLGLVAATTDVALTSAVEPTAANALRVTMAVACFVSLILAYGLWKGSGWAWWLGLIFVVLGIPVGLMSLPEGIIIAMIDLTIAFYLTRDPVKKFFGK